MRDLFFQWKRRAATDLFRVRDVVPSNTSAGTFGVSILTPPERRKEMGFTGHRCEGGEQTYKIRRSLRRINIINSYNEDCETRLFIPRGAFAAGAARRPPEIGPQSAMGLGSQYHRAIPPLDSELWETTGHNPSSHVGD
ncbi:MAG: hypothetical protein WDO73_37880 [Ignavibacteriota bacterium]